MPEQVKIIECPRDAWQGLKKTIPTETKIAYLRKLVELGFRHLDAVSFVAPKHVPQMADSEVVVKALSMQVAAGLARNPSRATAASSRPRCWHRTPSALAGAPAVLGLVGSTSTAR